MSVNTRVSLSALMSSETMDNANQVIATITHDESIDTPLSITNDNGTFYYHRDHQGSIIALTDSSGQVVESFTYDNHYGTITDHSKTTQTNNPYAYTGRELDTDELYYYRARYYDASIQRFLGEDPIEFNSTDFNFYRYIHNSPINFKDPLGLKRGGMFGDIVNESRDTIDPYTKYFYYYFLGKECKKLIKNYDCGCYSALECAIEIEQLRKKCKKLFVERGQKDLLDMLVP